MLAAAGMERERGGGGEASGGGEGARDGEGGETGEYGGDGAEVACAMLTHPTGPYPGASQCHSLCDELPHVGVRKDSEETRRPSLLPRKFTAEVRYFTLSGDHFTLYLRTYYSAYTRTDDKASNFWLSRYPLTLNSPRTRTPTRTTTMAHSHAHGGGHSHDDANPDDDWNLYQHLERAEALNAVVLGEGDITWAPNATGKALCVMRPNARRLQPGQVLSSDSDEQVIVKLQFAAPVSVRKLMARAACLQNTPPWQRQSRPPTTARGALALTCGGLQGKAAFDRAPHCRPLRRHPRRPDWPR